MSDIHVIFPKKKKGTDGNDTHEIIICQPAEIAPRGEPITWCFHSANSDIKSVEVIFEDEDAKFFANTEPKTRRRVPMVEGQADFYGRVPVYETLHEPKVAKYTIKAYGSEAGSDQLAELDPVIVTSQP